MPAVQWGKQANMETVMVQSDKGFGSGSRLWEQQGRAVEGFLEEQWWPVQVPKDLQDYLYEKEKR